MFEALFKGLFDSDLTTVISVGDFLLCLGWSLVLGLIMTLTYMFRTRYTKSFVVTLALLPAVVCVVIMLVNGNVGAGVAVAGAFSLVRFRSVPGTAKEICTLFLAMGAGLIAGMGYLGFAALFTVVMCAAFLAYNCLDLGAAKDLNLNTGKSSLQVAKNGFSPLEQYLQSGTSGSWTDVYSLAATFYFVLTGKEYDKINFTEVRGLAGVREATVDINGTAVNVAIANGMKGAKVLLDEIRAGTSKYHFIEIMGCPGGCINGGGQPYVRDVFLPNEDDDIMDTYIQKRAQALYSEDERQVLRQSHNNPQIQKLYDEYLGKPNSHKAHELLHTTYQARIGFND